MSHHFSIIGILLFVNLTWVHATMPTGDPIKGEQKAKTCAACHGTNGISQITQYPILAGQHAKYLFKQLKDYKNKKRINSTMLSMASILSEQDMADLAAYYAGLDPAEGTTPDDVIAKGQALYRGGNMEKKLPACIGCHGPKGNGTALSGFPKISGQHAEYISTQLKAFRTKERKNDMNDMMRSIADKLSDQDIEILSKYLGGLH